MPMAVTAVCRINGRAMKTAGGKLLLSTLLCMFSLAALAAPISEEVARVPTVTRLVKAFAELETGIITAFKQKNRAQLKQLIDQDFEMQVASQPTDPVPASEWIKASMAEASAYSYDFSQMSVHDLGQAAIVSFIWNSSDTAQQNPSADISIVDVWKKEGAGWKLAIRYAGAAQNRDFRFPGFTGDEPVIEKKY